MKSSKDCQSERYGSIVFLLKPQSAPKGCHPFFLLGFLAPLFFYWLTLDQVEASTSPARGRPQKTVRTTGSAPRPFQAGIGIQDITGPVAELGMMGYGRFGQKTEGLHTRLWSRALVLQNTPETNHLPQSKSPVALVIVDLLMVPLGARVLALEKLQPLYPGIFTEQNVMVLPTHTHSGPGGYSHYTLYNLTMLGFDWSHFHRVAQGIADSIRQAYESLEPARLFHTSGELEGLSKNRSRDAYLANGDAGEYSKDVDSLMTLIRVDRLDGSPMAALNWYALHNTSVPPENTLVSSDNKGMAALMMESNHLSTPIDYKSKDRPKFLALFANSNEGDVTPNVWEGSEPSPFDYATRSADGQAKFANSLFLSAKKPLQGPIQSIHRWVEMPNREVPRKWVPPQDLRSEHRLCKPAMGYSFAAGAEDGPSHVPGLVEGLTQDYLASHLRLADFPLMFALMVVFKNNEFEHECQYPKPIFMPAGYQDPPWTPGVLPFQIIQIGELAILGLPAEATTMAGRRLRQEAQEMLKAKGVSQVVIGGLANAYSGYLTTYEEYQLQHYEGGATAFGPLTFAMYQAITEDLAQGLGAKSQPSPSQGRPPTQGTPEWNFQPGVIFDGKRPWQKFGQVLLAPPPQVKVGSPVVVEFRSGHPRNRYTEVKSYLEVQRQNEGGGWQTVAYDWSLDTQFHWQRPLDPTCVACSTIQATWKVPSDARTGLYRIVHSGYYKPVGSPQAKPYEGVSPTFEVIH
jgi:neutral ceramidase